jgi:hypothetical protein
MTTRNTEELLTLATEFEDQAANFVIKKAKKDSADSKAKVRNRGKVVFPAESSNVKDNKDHFPINDADQARNALARAGQYSSVPSWYNGSLESLKSAISRAVHKHYPSIGKEKKSSFMSMLAKEAGHKFEAPRIVQLYNMLKSEPNEEDRKEIKKWIEEEQARLDKLRSKK